MGKITKMQPDKFKKVIREQDKPPRPATLGEPCEVTNWDLHIDAGHRIAHFVKIQDTKDGQKQALVHRPEQGRYFIAVKEPFCGFHYIWILCMTEGSQRINYRINSGDIQFVLWDIPAVEAPAAGPTDKPE